MSPNIQQQRGSSPSNGMDISKNTRNDPPANDHSTKTTATTKKTTTVSKHNAKRSPRKHHARGGDDSNVEEEDNADEEESSVDDEDEDVDEPDAIAPSDGTGEDDVSNAPRAGLTPSKKRTFSATKPSILSEADIPAYPRKKAQRRLSNNNGLFTYNSDENVPEVTVSEDEDDDDDYAAVNLISDSEDEDEIERFESKAITAHAESDDDSDDSDLDLGLDPGCVTGFFDEQMDLMPEDNNLMLYRLASPLPVTPATRKVHFDDTAASTHSSSETSSDAPIPDLFSDSTANLTTIQNALNYGYDSFNSPSNSDNSSYWDWQGDEFSAVPSLFDASENGDASTDAPSAPTEVREGAESGYDSMTAKPVSLSCC